MFASHCAVAVECDDDLLFADLTLGSLSLCLSLRIVILDFYNCSCLWDYFCTIIRGSSPFCDLVHTVEILNVVWWSKETFEVVRDTGGNTNIYFTSGSLNTSKSEEFLKRFGNGFIEDR